MRRVGSNQFKRQIHLFDTTHGADFDLIRFLLIVLTAIIIGLVAKAVRDKQASLVSLVTLQAHAEQRDWTQPELAPLPERERNAQLIRYYFGKDAEMATRVFTCESGLRTLAENDHNSDGSPDVGIAQIHVTPSHPFTVTEMQNPVANLLQAKHMFDDRGWQPWESSAKCWRDK